jgi:hypothetical protein
MLLKKRLITKKKAQKKAAGQKPAAPLSCYLRDRAKRTSLTDV